MPSAPTRPRSTLLTILLLWIAFYASFTLFTPPLLDDADSVHAEVAREMLLRHDYITLYANGIRYLEKAPLLYWSMAACMKVSQLLGATSPDALAVAARLPLAFTILALALLVEAFARRAFGSARAGLYAALIILSSFGIFIFTRITIPDAAVCLWTTLALYAFWRTEETPVVPAEQAPNVVIPAEQPQTIGSSTKQPQTIVISTEAKRSGEIAALATRSRRHHRSYCAFFAAACALNVLTKGLIGIVFPIAIVLIYLLLTRGLRGTVHRIRELHPFTSLLIFLVIAAPWHILAGLANPTQGQPAPFHYVGGHWQVPLPTDGNVRGWFWFYFMNEHLLRYLNLRIPRDYDTSPLWLFWGLCFVWMMPWSAFIFKAATQNSQQLFDSWRRRRIVPLQFFLNHGFVFGERAKMLLLFQIWAAFVLLFFSLSTRQEYYVLPTLPAIAILIGGWLSVDSRRNGREPIKTQAKCDRRANLRITTILLALGTLFAIAAAYFLLHTKSPAPNTDLATLLAQNPGDYALSMGHFLDLNAHALGLFRLPLAVAALSLFLGPLASLILRKRAKPHQATLALAAGAFGFLLAAHLGLRTFSPVLTSAHLAKQIAPQVHPEDLIAIHGEYEAGSTLGFYLQRNDIHILEGRSSNLWYGSFFPDAPPIFETPTTIAQKWPGPQRIFLWQSTTDEPRNLPALPGPVYILASGGGKEIVSNQPTH